MNDLRNKSHYETAAITDVEARYRVEAGTEKTSEIQRCLGEAAGMLAHKCRRFLDGYLVDAADDTLVTSGDLMYTFDFTERRGIGKAESLAEMMHAFIVHYALARFYASVSQGELSNKHSLLTNETATTLEELLYSKLPPR